MYSVILFTKQNTGFLSVTSRGLITFTADLKSCPKLDSKFPVTFVYFYKVLVLVCLNSVGKLFRHQNTTSFVTEGSVSVCLLFALKSLGQSGTAARDLRL